MSTNTSIRCDDGFSSEGGSQSARDRKYETNKLRTVKEMEAERLIIDEHNPMKLYEGPTIDTTDKTHIIAAGQNRFDPDGFQSGKGLQKDLFYVDPYITCSYCNLISFVDVAIIRRMIALSSNQVKSEHWRLPAEHLPPCQNCSRKDWFVIGSHDFSEEIANRERIRLERIQLEKRSVEKVQKAYRSYLRKMYGSALASAFLAGKYYKYVAAIKLTSVARGRLARRISITEKALRVIADCHPLIIKNALLPMNDRKKVFWYYRQIELDLLFANYIDLVEKLGFTPERMRVEQNIQEIAIRCTARKHFLIKLVQKTFRGYLHRRMVRFLRKEIARIFQRSVSRVLKIQRAFRGHFVRLNIIPQLMLDRQKEIDRKDYEKYRAHVKRSNDKKSNEVMVRNAYKKERAEEKTSRMTGRIDPASRHDSRKMRAFWDSTYADDKLAKRIDALQGTAQEILDEKNLMHKNNYDRREYIIARIAETGPSGYGNRNKPRHKKVGLLGQQQLLSLAATAFALPDQPQRSLENNSDRQQRLIGSDVGAHIMAGEDGASRLVEKEGEMEECSRSAAMRQYFYQEQLDIVDKIVIRQEVTRTDSVTTVESTARHKQELKDYNVARAVQGVIRHQPLGNFHGSTHAEEGDVSDIAAALAVTAMVVSDTKDDKEHKRPGNNAGSNLSAAEEHSLHHVHHHNTPSDHHHLVHELKYGKHKNRKYMHAGAKITSRGFKFPEGINIDHMKWLMDEDL